MIGPSNILFSCFQTVDGLILEKPVDKQDAYCMLSRCFYPKSIKLVVKCIAHV